MVAQNQITSEEQTGQTDVTTIKSLQYTSSMTSMLNKAANTNTANKEVPPVPPTDTHTPPPTNQTTETINTTQYSVDHEDETEHHEPATHTQSPRPAPLVHSDSRELIRRPSGNNLNGEDENQLNEPIKPLWKREVTKQERVIYYTTLDATGTKQVMNINYIVPTLFCIAQLSHIYYMLSLYVIELV